jgi:protein subunit release factor A
MKNSLLLELRAAVGGDDSKLLIKDMMDIYIKVCKINSFEYKILEQNDGLITI